MKIYTYHQDINHKNQPELIELWKISWSRQGYEPIVLNLEHAKRHPYFETLNSEMRKIFKEITSKEISDYGMSCWFRWLAYATQKEEKFYVSDYDAINVNFPIKEPNDKLHLMDNACPFFASGTPKQFENLCKTFVEVSNKRIEILKQQANHYHDQEFFQYNFMPQKNDSAEDLRNQHNILMTRDRTKFGGSDINTSSLVYHISHYYTWVLREKRQKYKNHDPSQLRITIVKKLLGMQSE